MTSTPNRPALPRRSARLRIASLSVLAALGSGQMTQAGENPVIPVEPMVFVPLNPKIAPQGQFTIIPPQNTGTIVEETQSAGSGSGDGTGTGSGSSSGTGTGTGAASGAGADPQDDVLDPEILTFRNAETLSDVTTAAIAKAFNDATAFCSNISQREYVADCFAYEYRRIADALPDTGDYAEVKQAVEEAADKMERVVRQARSRSKPPARAVRQGANPRRTKRPLTPVATEAVPAVAEATAQIIEEAQTVLIRSSENSEERRRQFQRIVAAMDTGTILLRSL